MNAKPIETIYKGYRFRSRLEARWAVFFDELGFEWQYEIEGYELDGVWYLPDFQTINGWFEVKPNRDLTEREAQVADKLGKQGQPVIVVFGDPYDLFGEFYPQNYLVFDGQEVEIFNPLYKLLHCLGMLDWDSEIWVAFRETHQEFHEFWSALQRHEDRTEAGKEKLNQMCLHWSREIRATSRRLDQVIEAGLAQCKQAAKEARSARFEFGENGARR